MMLVLPLVMLLVHVSNDVTITKLLMMLVLPLVMLLFHVSNDVTIMKLLMMFRIMFSYDVIMLL